MANYNEQQIVGTKRQRVARLIVDVPVKGKASMTILEETVVEFDGETRSQPSGSLLVEFDATATFPLRHPGTDELIGSQSSHEALQVLLYSLARYEQLRRDEATQSNPSI